MVKPWLNHGLKTASLLEAEAHGSSFYATTARLPDAHINKSTRLDLPSGLMTDMTVSGKPEASEPSLYSLRSLRVAHLFRSVSWWQLALCVLPHLEALPGTWESVVQMVLAVSATKAPLANFTRGSQTGCLWK